MYIRKASPVVVEDFLFNFLPSFSTSEIAGVFLGLCPEFVAA